jgi:hypothetical protein
LGVIDSLGALVKAFPQARVVAFADLSSNMVLASQGPQLVTQEHLERLCQQARSSFDDPLFSLALEAYGEPRAAIQLGESELKVFLRSDIEPADALCCICQHGIDLEGFVRKLGETLESISGAG